MRDLYLLDPEITFLNHGSFGACPNPVFEVYQRRQRELERQPVEFLGRRFRALMREARTALAAYVGAAADGLVFMPNATTALNLVARSLPLKPGDEVLTTDHEYGAVDRAWRWVCERTGARYTAQRLPPPFSSSADIIDRLWSAVTARTKVIAISHITSPTAIILPVAEIARRARARGILTVVDGAHAPGQIELTLEAIGADFYGGNCHKWLSAPKGAAFLYARKEVQHLLEPLVVSWGWRSGGDWEAESPFITLLEWQGTHDISAWLAVPAAIDFMAEHRWQAVRRHCHELAAYARCRVTELTGLDALTPDSDAWYSQMVALPLPRCDAQGLQRELYRRFRIEVPVIDWQGRQLLRVSVQAYNTADDIDRLVEALSSLLPAYQRT